MSVIDDGDAHLLPSNASPLERLISATGGARIDGIPVPIDLLKRPYEVPAQFLPHLAWEVSLDVWDENWPEWRKRRAIAKSIGLHRLKGTLAGVEGWLDILGAALQSYVIPPIGAFVGSNRTPAEKAAFNAQFAELRIYLESDTGSADADLYVADGFVGVDFVTISTASDRYGRRAYVVDRGVTRQVPMLPVSWAAADAINEGLVGVVLPGEDDGGFFIRDACLGNANVTAAKITSRLLTIAADRSFVPISPQPVLIGSDVAPMALISVIPERIAVKGTIGPDVLHVNAGYVGDFAGEKDTDLRIYDRYYLFDPTRVAGTPGSDGAFFLDYTRLSIPPFYAELRVDFPGFDPIPTFMIGDGFVGDACLMPVQGQMDKVAACIRAAKALRDDVWFTTQTKRPIQFSDGIPIDGSVGFDTLVSIFD